MGWHNLASIVMVGVLSGLFVGCSGQPQAIDEVESSRSASSERVLSSVADSSEAMAVSSLSLSSLSMSSSAQSSVSNVDSAVPFDALFGGLSESQRMQMYSFKEQGGRIVMEAEHFAKQLYGSQDYRGARWWMVNSLEQQASELPVFEDACDLAYLEMENIKQHWALLGDRNDGSPQTVLWDKAKGTGKLGGQALTGREIFEVFKCDPDPNHAQGASGGKYLELVPDMLYSNFDAIPHGLSHWPTGKEAPKVFWRLNSAGGKYTVHLRVLRGHSTVGMVDGKKVNALDTDSGDIHIGAVTTPGYKSAPQQSRVGPSSNQNGQWVWVQSEVNLPKGQGYFFVAGREDGFEIDKIVLSKNGCGDCRGVGPNSSPTISQ